MARARFTDGDEITRIAIDDMIGERTKHPCADVEASEGIRTIVEKSRDGERLASIIATEFARIAERIATEAASADDVERNGHD